jgi:hypothetical protein
LGSGVREADILHFYSPGLPEQEIDAGGSMKQLIPALLVLTAFALWTAPSNADSPKFLTFDHAVQRTHGSNGTTITINFGTVPYHLPGGTSLSAGGWQVH